MLKVARFPAGIIRQHGNRRLLSAEHACRACVPTTSIDCVVKMVEARGKQTASHEFLEAI